MNAMVQDRFIKVMFLCALSFFAIALHGCGTPTLNADPEQLAQSLKTEVTGWDKWKQHASFSGIQESKDKTHGAYVAIYMNEKAASVQGSLSGAFPDGSIFVKRGYDDKEGQKPKAWITIMKKIAGSDAANGDWFTMSLADDGSVSKYKADEKVGSCMGCHSSAKETYDYIRFIKDENITF